jgi:hypothetical protein
VAYSGSFVKDQATDAVLPAKVELAPAPKLPTLVEADALAVNVPVVAVPGLLTVFV